MDWSNENWVRLYTRDTEDDLVLSWEARAVWKEMLTKFDRSGLIELKRGRQGLAALIRYPIEVVEIAVPQLVTDGRIRELPNGYFAPNFMTAQEAPASDKHRKRVSRENRRAKSEAASRGHSVTNRDQQPESVTNRDHLSADPSHRSLLPNLTVQDLDQRSDADLDQGNPSELPGSGAIVGAERDQGEVESAPGSHLRHLLPHQFRHANPERDRQRSRLVTEAWQYALAAHNALRLEGVDPSAQPWPALPPGDSPPMVELKARVAELLVGGDWEGARATIRRRVDVAAAAARRDDVRHLRWFTPMRIWDRTSFAKDAEISPAQAAAPRAGPRSAPPRGTPEVDPEPPRKIRTL